MKQKEIDYSLLSNRELTNVTVGYLIEANKSIKEAQDIIGSLEKEIRMSKKSEIKVAPRIKAHMDYYNDLCLELGGILYN